VLGFLKSLPFHGNLGNNTTNVSVDVPVQVLGPSGTGYLTGITAIMGGETHNLALKSDGTVWAWGSNYWGGNDAGYGLLGTGSSATYSTVPTQLTSFTTSALMASGGDSLSAVLLTDGTIWTMGSNLTGQLGNGSSVSQSLVPVQVTALSGIIFMTARDEHAQAIDSNGHIWSWGDGLQGELGNGANLNSYIPVQLQAF